jgi:hypothetical protein
VAIAAPPPLGPVGFATTLGGAGATGWGGAGATGWAGTFDFAAGLVLAKTTLPVGAKSLGEISGAVIWSSDIEASAKRWRLAAAAPALPTAGDSDVAVAAVATETWPHRGHFALRPRCRESNLKSAPHPAHWQAMSIARNPASPLSHHLGGRYPILSVLLPSRLSAESSLKPLKNQGQFPLFIDHFLIPDRRLQSIYRFSKR